MKWNQCKFSYDGMSKECSDCICLLVILIDFVFKLGKNYYTRVCLEEYNDIV